MRRSSAWSRPLQRTARSLGCPPGCLTSIALPGGLQNGRLYVVAARPAMGKSLLSLEIARHVAISER